MTSCNRCIMPDTIPGISFDEDGICNFCLEFRDVGYDGEKKLNEIMTIAKRRNGPYDCIVPLSGGRDSTYVLYKAKAIYKLKVLAVSYDNEFRTEQALINMKNACHILGVDFISIRSKINIAHKVVRSGVCAAVTFGQFGLCRACTYGYKSAVYRYAEKYDVPLILWGESQYEATKDIENRVYANLKMSSSHFKKFLNVNFYLNEYYSLLQRIEFPVAGNNWLHRGDPILKNANIKEIRLFHYIPWNREEIKQTIITQLSWKKPVDHISTWRTDCSLHSLVNFVYFKQYGCSKDCFGYHKMINAGQMSREEALAQEEQMMVHYNDKVREILLEKIRVSKRELKRIESFQTNYFNS